MSWARARPARGCARKPRRPRDRPRRGGPGLELGQPGGRGSARRRYHIPPVGGVAP